MGGKPWNLLLTTCIPLNFASKNPSRAEAILGQAVARSGADYGVPSGPATSAEGMNVDEPSALVVSTSNQSNARPAPSVGTPIQLAPSAAAYRKPGLCVGTSATAGIGAANMAVVGAANNGSASAKGVFGQLSDLVFGW